VIKTSVNAEDKQICPGNSGVNKDDNGRLRLSLNVNFIDNKNTPIIYEVIDYCISTDNAMLC
jgi:hypothetical protein